MKVIATAKGSYRSSRKRPGTVFVLSDPKHFSPSWMKEVKEKADEAPVKAPAKPTVQTLKEAGTESTKTFTDVVSKTGKTSELLR